MLSPTNKTHTRLWSRFTPLAILLVLLGGLGYLASHRQDLYDWARLRNYQAPQAVAQIAVQDTMTDYGRKILYVNHPLLADKASFGNYCPKGGGEQTLVLGCYHGGQAGIYVLAVDDPRLDGVEQVTAAHEMLHGAYDRLSSQERSQVDGWLQDYYQHGLQDERIRKTIDAYRQSEPNDVVNEMHSIFATEVDNLPAPLEHYYQRYFSDRAAVAHLADRYQAEFTLRQAAVARADGQLSSLKSQITGLEADLKAKQASITQLEASLVRKRDSGDISGYNAGVPIYNHLIDTYNAEVTQVQNLIAQYNQLVASRNATALEQNQLAEELGTDVKQINN